MAQQRVNASNCFSQKFPFEVLPKVMTGLSGCFYGLCPPPNPLPYNTLLAPPLHPIPFCPPIPHFQPTQPSFPPTSPNPTPSHTLDLSYPHPLPSTHQSTYSLPSSSCQAADGVPVSVFVATVYYKTFPILLLMVYQYQFVMS